LEHMAANGTDNSIVQVDADTYAVAYRGKMGDGFITTFTISSNGSSITEVASYEYDTSDASYNSLVQADTDTYVLAYTGPDDDGYISTFSISSNGSSITEVLDLEHDTDKGRHNSLVQLDSDTYVLAYEGLNSDGFIKTFTVYSDGSLPVELTSFELISTREEDITLQWITESEINNLGFILDRRTPNTDWTQIASYITDQELQGQGSVSHQTIYTYTDNTVINNETYDYRLADVDHDGNVEYHSTQLMGISISSTLPEQYVLYQNYPNPFNPVTKIRYDLPDDAYVTLTIHDMMGRRVRALVDGPQTAGNRSIQWNGTDEQGRFIPAGLYLFSISLGQFNETSKMILLK